MLSRAQEARVRALLWSSLAGTIQIYCLEHLAAAAMISSGHLPDLAAFVRSLHERGADGTAVTKASQLSAAIDAKSPGDMVKLTYLRDGKTKTATVPLETRPS